MGSAWRWKKGERSLQALKALTWLWLLRYFTHISHASLNVPMWRKWMIMLLERWEISRMGG